MDPLTTNQIIFLYTTLPICYVGLGLVTSYGILNYSATDKRVFFVCVAWPLILVYKIAKGFITSTYEVFKNGI